MPARPNAKQRALRALAEGATATLDLLADASGRSLRMLRYQAEEEGWALDRAPQEDVAGRVRSIAAVLLDRVEVLGRTAVEEGGRIDRTEIDGIIAIIRGLDKIDEIMRPNEAAKENQIKENEDLAAVLERINERIVELAKDFAAEMDPCECGSGRRLAAARRVDQVRKA